MTFDKFDETMNPCLWIEDYCNAWASPLLNIFMARRDGNLRELRENSLDTFKEYVAKKTYYGQRCDLTTIPERFIYQTNKLVGIYNDLIAQEKLDLDKLERVANLAKKVIYRSSDKIKGK